MLTIFETNNFRKDVKKLRKRGQILEALADIIDKLARNQPLPSSCKNHKLIGNWAPYWECHIEFDWLLIYETTDTALHLIRTGTHADLFK